MIKHFLKIAHAKAEEAVAKSEASVLEVEDLEVEATPEELVMQSVSGDKDRERTDREMVQPWLKFLWESYRSILDVLRNNSKLESLYAAAAHRAYNFCVMYKRGPEFRRLCDLIRLHLTNLNRFKDQRDRPDITNPETLNLYLSTRFEQLRYAAELGMYQEAFRTVEDIHTLQALAGRQPHPLTMVAYYTRLQKVFWASDCQLYHAYAWYKIYSLSRQHNKALKEGDLRLMATHCVLAALSVLPYDRAAVGGVHDPELAREKQERVSSILGFKDETGAASVVSRASLISELRTKGLLDLCPPEVRSVFHLLESEFNPMGMYTKAEPQVAAVEALGAQMVFSSGFPSQEAGFEKYSEPLKRLAVLQMVKQLGRIYSSMRLESLGELLRLSFKEVEKVVMEAVKGGFANVRLDHRNGYVIFERQSSITTDSSVVVSLGKVAGGLQAAFSMLPVSAAAAAARNAERSATSRLHLSQLEEEHRRCLARRVLIERRKEDKENQEKEKEKEENKRRMEQDRQREEEERKRIEAEAERRAQERIRQDMEEREREETRALMEAAGKGSELRDGEVVDKAKLQQEALSAQIKERQEAARKLQRSMRQLDHYQRAKREAEVPVIKTMYKQQLIDDEQAHGARTEKFLEDHRSAWENDVAEKERTSRILADAEALTKSIVEERQRLHEEACEARVERMKANAAARKSERHMARRFAYVEREQEKWYEQKRLQEEEEAEHLRAEEEERRKAEEERRRAEEERRERASAGGSYRPPRRGGDEGGGYQPPGGRGDRRDDRRDDRYGPPRGGGGYGRDRYDDRRDDRRDDRYGPPRGGGGYGRDRYDDRRDGPPRGGGSGSYAPPGRR